MPFEGFGPYGNEERPAPAFALPDGAGGTVRLWDYKQRKSLVIYLLNSQVLEENFLKVLQADNAAYQAEKAQLLVIVAVDSPTVQELTARLGLSYPLLADPDLLTHTRYLKIIYPQYEPTRPGPKPVALFIADRFGSIYRYASSTDQTKLPGQAEVLEIIEFLHNLCNP